MQTYDILTCKKDYILGAEQRSNYQRRVTHKAQVHNSDHSILLTQCSVQKHGFACIWSQKYELVYDFLRYVTPPLLVHDISCGGKYPL